MKVEAIHGTPAVWRLQRSGAGSHPQRQREAFDTLLEANGALRAVAAAHQHDPTAQCLASTIHGVAVGGTTAVSPS